MGLPPPPKAPAGFAPGRAPGSARRTSSIDVDWPDGREGAMRLVGRARDILTPANGADLITLAEGAFEARLDAERHILAITATPALPGVQGLKGERAGGRLRGAIERTLPEEKKAGTPLHLLLDDLAGTSLVAPWAWSRWDPDWIEQIQRRKADPRFAAAFNRENICSGLRTGSSGLNFAGDGIATPDLRNPEDPEGLHAFPALQGPSMRRARRIDVSRDGVIRIDAHFQDSASTPEGGRSALHEYGLRATADPVSMTLQSIEAEPRVLPFAECPAAADNVSRLVGTPLARLREVVLERLKGTVGCTHLNDALRALAEVPVLVGMIDVHVGASDDHAQAKAASAQR
jgi:hypothetical protein